MNVANVLEALNGHPLRVMRTRHNLTLEGLAKKVKISTATVWRAENGYPISAESRRLLCAYFNATSQELGLIEHIKKEKMQKDVVPSLTNLSPSREMVTTTPDQLYDIPSVPTIIFKQGQTLDVLTEQQDQVSLEQQLGAWLAIEACNIGSLFDAGWTLEAILESLRVVLQGVQGMPPTMRRQLLQLGNAAVVSHVNVPMREHVSGEERMQLIRSLNESIATGWKLCHTTDSSQALIIGEAQLYLLQRYHSVLPSRDRTLFYTSIYNLLGEALHLQGRPHEALEMHINAHVAAMATGNSLYIAQSLICQSSLYQTLCQYQKAIEATQEALRVIGDSNDEATLRAKAHFLACWADYAISMEDYTIAQNKIDASASFLDYLQPDEEFDHSSWLQLVGKYAFATRDYTTAVGHLEQALVELPPDWIVRRVLVLLPMIASRAWIGDKEGSIAVMHKAVAAICTLNSPHFGKPMHKAFQGLLSVFPRDSNVQEFVLNMRCKMPKPSVILDKDIPHVLPVGEIKR